MCPITVLQIERDFIEAARRNDVPTMKILEKNVNINARNVVSKLSRKYPH